MQENAKLTNKQQYAIRAAKKDKINILLRRAKSGEFKIEVQDDEAVEIAPAQALADEKSGNAIMITPEHKIRFFSVKARQSFKNIDINDGIA